MATINDIVLIYLEDTPVSFARVEAIEPDHKKDWYQIKLLMLQIPLQVVTWILKDLYINGDDFFMNGKKMRLETVECPEEELPDSQDDSPDTPTPKLAKEAIKKETAKQQQTKERETEEQPSRDQDRKPSGGKIISFTDLKKKKPGTEPEPDIG